MTQAIPNPCDIPGAKFATGCMAADAAGKAKDKVDKAADTASKAIEFGKDPFGFIAQKEAEAAKDLTETVIPALSRLTQPDLNQEWFLNAYAISFAAALFGWVLITLYDIATFRARGESGREVIDSLVKWTPIFIGGSMFGPAIGIFLVKGIGYLNTALVNWGISASVGKIVDEFRPLIEEDPSKFLGGSFMAMLVLACLVLALLLVLVVLVIMMVTLYLSGVVLPLSLMWATKIGQRDKGRKVIMVWAGVLCSQPLIFLLLGVAFSGAADQMMEVLADSSTDPSDAKLENLVQLLVVIIMLVVATLGPTSLAAYAPVGPTEGSASGPEVNARGAGKGKSGGARGGAGPSSSSSSQTSQVAQQNAAQGPSSSMGSGMGSSGGTAASMGSSGGTAASGTAAAGTAAGAAATGGTLVAAKAAQEGGKAAKEKASEAKDKSQEAAQEGGASGQDGESGDSSAGKNGAPGENSTGDGSQQSGLAAKVGDNGGKGQGGGQEKGSDGGISKGSGSGALKGAGKAAGHIGGRAAGLAQQAGDFAQDQMDHHRDGARGRR